MKKEFRDSSGQGTLAIDTHALAYIADRKQYISPFLFGQNQKQAI